MRNGLSDQLKRPLWRNILGATESEVNATGNKNIARATWPENRTR